MAVQPNKYTTINTHDTETIHTIKKEPRPSFRDINTPIGNIEPSIRV